MYSRIRANEQKHKFILDTLAMSSTALNLYETNDKDVCSCEAEL